MKQSKKTLELTAETDELPCLATMQVKFKNSNVSWLFNKHNSITFSKDKKVSFEKHLKTSMKVYLFDLFFRKNVKLFAL